MLIKKLVAIAILSLAITCAVSGQESVRDIRPAAKTPKTTIKKPTTVKERTETVDNNESVRNTQQVRSGNRGGTVSNQRRSRNSSRTNSLVMVPDWKGATTVKPNGQGRRTNSNPRTSRSSSTSTVRDRKTSGPVDVEAGKTSLLNQQTQTPQPRQMNKPDLTEQLSVRSNRQSSGVTQNQRRGNTSTIKKPTKRDWLAGNQTTVNVVTKKPTSGKNAKRKRNR